MKKLSALHHGLCMFYCVERNWLETTIKGGDGSSAFKHPSSVHFCISVKMQSSTKLRLLATFVELLFLTSAWASSLNILSKNSNTNSGRKEKVINMASVMPPSRAATGKANGRSLLQASIGIGGIPLIPNIPPIPFIGSSPIIPTIPTIPTTQPPSTVLPPVPTIPTVPPTPLIPTIPSISPPPPVLPNIPTTTPPTLPPPVLPTIPRFPWDLLPPPALPLIPTPLQPLLPPLLIPTIPTTPPLDKKTSTTTP